MELEGRGELLTGLDIVLTGTYVDAEITQGTPASGITAMSINLNCARDEFLSLD